MAVHRFLITGANGFVGRVLTQHLLNVGHMVKGTILPGESSGTLSAGVVPTVVAPLGPDTVWQQALQDVDTVIHLAARVHMMKDKAIDPLTEYRKVNVEGTRRLAQEAVRNGVKRLVFASSIKVNGEESLIPYTETSPTQPMGPYGISKLEAELALCSIAEESGLEVVIARSPLVYGPGVKANFLSLIKAVSKGIPLPFASITNSRSLIYVANLADVLTLCAEHPAAVGNTYLISDGEDISTPELVRIMADAIGAPSRLFPCPSVLLRFSGILTGRVESVERLTGSLIVDSSCIRRQLGWVPPFSVFSGLKATADWYSQRLGRFK